jgi:hypothetical protein
MFERASKKLGLEQAVLGTRNFAEVDLEENEKGRPKVMPIKRKSSMFIPFSSPMIPNS